MPTQAYCYGAAGDPADPHLMFQMAQIYEHGWGTLADRQYAKRWYRDSANANDAAAMVRLAQMYSQDLGNTSNAKAQAWYRAQIDQLYAKAALLGNKDAKRWITSPH